MDAQKRFLDELDGALQYRDSLHLRRSLMLPQGIDFTSNDYLGLNSSETFLQGISDAWNEYEPGATASRLLRGHHESHHNVERELAIFCNVESTLLFTSGFALNAGLYAAITTADDAIFSDQYNHASIIDGLRLSKATKHIYPHQRLDLLEAMLEKRPPGQRAFVVVESLYSMDGDITDLRRLADVCERQQALLIIDEAHATGLFGAKGAGLIEEHGIREQTLLSIHTAGKALATQGAWVASSTIMIEHLVNHCRSFIYSTGMSPAMSAGLNFALRFAQQHPDLRHAAKDNAAFFRSCANQLELPVPAASSGPIVPVMIGDDQHALVVAARLQAQGFDIRAIRPPTVPPGTARLRVVIHASHQRDTMRTLADAIALTLKEVQ